MSTLAEQLRTVLPADRVTDEANELRLRAADFWPRSVMARRRGERTTTPGAVVLPDNRDEVARVLAWCTAERVPVVPYGAGTGVCGGAIAAPSGVTIDLKRMNRVVDLDEISGTVTVQPGIIAQALEDHLAHRGWTLGHYPSSIHCSTIGGLLAIRSAGQASTGYGKLEDQVVGLEVVLADGTIVVSKPVPSSAAGPDLKRLFLGGEGVTGVITEATLRLRPAPEAVRDRGVLFADFASGMEAARQMMRGNVRPAVFRLYDETDTAVVFGSQGLDVPDGCLAVFGAEGDPELAGFVHDRVLAVLTGNGGADLGEEPGRHWREHRHDVSYRFAEYMKPGGSFGDAVMLDTMEVAATWARLLPTYDGVRAALSENADLVLAHMSHVYPDGGAIYFTFGAAQEGDEDEALIRYDAAWEAGQRAALDAGATISHHHGIGTLRVPWVAEELGEGGYEVLQRVKRSLDPAGVLNPGTLGLGSRS